MQKRIFSYVISCLVIVMISMVFSSAYGYSQEIENLLFNATRAFNQNNLNDSLSNYDQVLKIDPNNKVALGNKGVVLANLQRYNESITYFDQVLKIDPNNIDALNNKAAALIKLGRYNEAIVNFDKVLTIDPKNIVALSNKKTIPISHFLNSTLNNGTDYYAYCQIEIRNKDNQLIAYLEPEDISISDPSFFNSVMDTLTVGKFVNNSVEKTFVYKEGKKFELTKIILMDTVMHEETLSAQTGYADRGTWVLTASHDGYELEPGDVLKSTWDVIRPVQ